MHQRKPIPRRRRRRSPARAGFTLMEVLLVVAILVILGSLAFFGVEELLEGANEDTTRIQIEALEDQVQRYKIDMRQAPSTLDDLVIEPTTQTGTGTRSRWRGPYVEGGEIPMDAWGNPYQMEVNESNKVVVYSMGADGTQGTDDDIRSDQ